MAPISLHKKTQEDILITLIQGKDGIAWAENRTGWDKSTGIDG